MVRVTGAGGFNNDVGIASQAFFNQTQLQRTDGHGCRQRQAVRGDIAVRQHQQNRAVTHFLFAFVTEFLDELLHILFGRIVRNIQRFRAIVFAVECGQLFKVRPQQDWRFEAQTVSLTFGFAEHVHLAADAGRQRHHVGFAQRIDWRVSDLRKLLAEVVIHDTRTAGEHGKWRVVTHGADGFLTVFTQYADDLIEFFAAVAELLLESFQ
ncbi:hypothetical protein SRABI106_03047 [Rahnella aquatilis]|nr:hypothetical protein SRABI106_03047 [Rahnella aquatilis]